MSGPSGSVEITIVAQHRVGTVPERLPTCQQDGWTEGIMCARCFVVFSGMETVPAKGHTPEEDPAIEATCTSAGRTAGSHCAGCGVCIVAQVKIPATGHSYVQRILRAPTCTEPGMAEYICSACKDRYTGELEALGHTYEVVSEKKGTCVEEGEITYVCKDCGATYTEKTGLGDHDLQGSCTCILCGAIDSEFVPSAIAGDGGTYNGQDGETMTFVSNDSYGCFQSVMVDGGALSPGDYTPEKGSIQVTLPSSYLQGLDPGEHVLTILSAHGTVDFHFTVAGTALKTRDVLTQSEYNDGRDTETRETGEDEPDTEADAPSGEMSPQTGDDSHLLVTAVLLVLSITAIVMTVMIARKTPQG